MKKFAPSTTRFAVLTGLFFAAPLVMGGCELECDADADSGLEKVVDEIGDEAEEVAEKLDDDGR